MARISTYVKDQFINFNDLLVGSEFGGIGANGRRLYTTKNYRIGDLADFFGLTAESINTRLDTHNTRLDTYLGIYNDDGSFTYSTAFATQSLGVISTAGYASAYFVTNLGAIVGTLDEDGNLVQLSEAFANQVLNATSSTKFASTLFATNLASSFGSWNPDGSISVLSSSFADSVFSTMNTSSLASASYVNNLSSSLGSFNPDGTLASLSESFADTVFSTMNTSTLASASSVTNLSAALSLKPSITRATTAPSIQQEVENELGAVTIPQSPPNGSMWIDISTTAVTDSSGNVTQEPKNEMYVLAGAAGSAAWTLTKDASLLNTITSLATATSSLSVLTTADIAKAEQLTELEAQFTLDGSDPPVITGLNPGKTIAAATNTARNTAIATANKASATRENNLTANVQKVFNQNSAPSVTLATQMTANVNSAITDSVDLVIDGQSSGTIVEGMVITGSGISGDVVVITVTNQNTLVLSSPQTLANDAVLTFNKAQSPSVNSLWYDTTNVSRVVKNAETGVDTTTSVPGNILHVLTATGSSPYYSWVQNPDALLATQASVNTTASATADINGKLSSRYGVKVTAGGVFAGMELLANSDATGAISDIIFTSTNFKIHTISGTTVSNVAPFSVSGNTVSINGDLKIGSSTVSSIATKANSANQDTTSTIRSGTTAANVGLANIVNSNFDANGNVIGGAVGGTTINSTKIFQGTGTFGNANTGFYLDNGGNFSLRNKLVFNGSTGDLSIAGAITATSLTLSAGVTLGASSVTGLAAVATTGLLAAASVTGLANVATTGSLSDVSGVGALASLNTISSTYIDSNSITTGKIAAGTIVANDIAANTITATNISSLNFSGKTATFDTGSIGGWLIGSTTLTSTNNLITLSSGNYSLPSTFVIGTPSTANFPYNVTIQQTSNTSANGTYVDASTSPAVTNPHSTTRFTSNDKSSGVPAVFSIKFSNNSFILRAYFGANKTMTGNFSARIGFDIADLSYNVVAGPFTKTVGGVATYATDASGYAYITIPYNYEVTGTTSGLVDGTTYFIRTQISNVVFKGQYNTTGINVALIARTPQIVSGTINYAVGRTEVFGGGMQVVGSSDYYFKANRGTNTVSAPFLESAGFFKHYGDLNVVGTLDASTKNFKIDHPLDSMNETHYLIHSSIEGPRADLIYRGRIRLYYGRAFVNIDLNSGMTNGTFESLCTNVQCFTTNETSWHAVKASVDGNILYIESENENSIDDISWMVVGERKDYGVVSSTNTDSTGKLIVEIEK